MKVLSSNPPNYQDFKVQEKLRVWLHEFDEQLIRKLNGELEKYKYLTGNQMSVVDIIVYCEIHQVLKMYGRQLPRRFAKINEWYEEIDGLEAVQSVNAKLDEVLNEHDLRETAQ